MDRAESEAIADIVQKNEENIRERILSDFRQKRLIQRKNLSKRKLQTITELERVEEQYKETTEDPASLGDINAVLRQLNKTVKTKFARTQDGMRTGLEGHGEPQDDEIPVLSIVTDLTLQLKKEPWYIMAKHVADAA